MKQIKYYYTYDNLSPYLEWYNSLDKSVQVRIDKRIIKLEHGVYGEIRKLQNSELSELKMDFGAGYRIYYLDIDDYLILFLAGSDKKKQKKTIEIANKYYNDFMNKQEN